VWTRINYVVFFTYISDDGLHMTWIDHIACSLPLEQFVQDVNVLYGNVCSDHRPLLTLPHLYPLILLLIGLRQEVRVLAIMTALG